MIGIVGFGIQQSYKHAQDKKRKDDLHKVEVYLYNNGTKMGDVKSISTVYDSKSANYDVIVIFKNEPNTKYQFFYSEDQNKSYLSRVYKLSDGEWEPIPNGESMHGKDFRPN